jgi:hypothetical protein
MKTLIITVAQINCIYGKVEYNLSHAYEMAFEEVHHSNRICFVEAGTKTIIKIYCHHY